MKVVNAKMKMGMLRKGATILSSQLDEIGNIRANNKNASKRCELLFTWNGKRKIKEVKMSANVKFNRFHQCSKIISQSID